MSGGTQRLTRAGYSSFSGRIQAEVKTTLT